MSHGEFREIQIARKSMRRPLLNGMSICWSQLGQYKEYPNHFWMNFHKKFGLKSRMDTSTSNPDVSTLRPLR